MSGFHICIGGPIDGEYRKMEDGCKLMRVAELPSAPSIAFSYEDAPIPPKPCSVRAHNYYLATSRRHGFAWVHEDYKGEVK